MWFKFVGCETADEDEAFSGLERRGFQGVGRYPWKFVWFFSSSMLVLMKGICNISNCSFYPTSLVSCYTKARSNIYNCSLYVATSNGLRVMSTLPSLKLTTSPSSSKMFVFQTFLTSNVVSIVPLLMPPKLS